MGNENEYKTLSHGLDNKNSLRVIEFKSPEDIDKFIEKLKGLKKRYNEINAEGHI